MQIPMLETIRAGLDAGRVVPYLGSGVLALAGADSAIPATQEALADRLTSAASVPHKIRNNLTAAAQFIENFKHRKTVTKAMTEAFAADVAPNLLHRFLATLPVLPLLVHAWYDDLPQQALAGRRGCGMVQGVSQAEHFGQWVQYFRADRSVFGDRMEGAGAAESKAPEAAEADEAAYWTTVLYQPLGSVSPAANFLVSDSDFVEVLTEIDIQTPIPDIVQNLRTGRNFLFLGCRFATQLERIFAHQITKRSSDRHWAVLPQQPTRNESSFLERHNIERLDVSLQEFVAALAATGPAGEARSLAAFA
jgi:hypothetical protein